MARKANVFPLYLLRKQSGQARVRFKGRDYLLGESGLESSRIAYGKLISQVPWQHINRSNCTLQTWKSSTK